MNPPLRNAALCLATLLALSACTAPELRDGRALTFNVEGPGLVKMEAVNVHPFWLTGSEPFCLWDVKVQGFKNTEIYPGPGYHRNPVCATKKSKADGVYELQTGGHAVPVYVATHLRLEFRRSADGELERYSTTVPFAEHKAKGERLNSPRFVIEQKFVRATAWRFGRNGGYVEDIELNVVRTAGKEN